MFRRGFRFGGRFGFGDRLGFEEGLGLVDRSGLVDRRGRRRRCQRWLGRGCRLGFEGVTVFRRGFRFGGRFGFDHRFGLGDRLGFDHRLGFEEGLRLSHGLDHRCRLGERFGRSCRGGGRNRRRNSTLSEVVPADRGEQRRLRLRIRNCRWGNGGRRTRGRAVSLRARATLGPDLRIPVMRRKDRLLHGAAGGTRPAWKRRSRREGRLRRFSRARVDLPAVGSRGSRRLRDRTRGTLREDSGPVATARTNPHGRHGHPHRGRRCLRRRLSGGRLRLRLGGRILDERKVRLGSGNWRGFRYWSRYRVAGGPGDCGGVGRRRSLGHSNGSLPVRGRRDTRGRGRWRGDICRQGRRRLGHRSGYRVAGGPGDCRGRGWCRRIGDRNGRHAPSGRGHRWWNIAGSARRGRSRGLGDWNGRRLTGGFRNDGGRGWILVRGPGERRGHGRILVRGLGDCCGRGFRDRLA